MIGLSPISCLEMSCFLKSLLQKFTNTNKCIRTVYTSSYDRIVSEKEASQPVFRYVGKHRKRYKRIHVCGLTVTGALGVLELPVPQNQLRMAPTYNQVYPYRLMIDDIDNIACGYGYTVFSSKHTASMKVWGCGINTDSQLGFQRGRHFKDPKLAKTSYQYVMEPSPVPLPLKSSNKTRVIDIACGRAHTLVLTDESGIFAMGNNAYGQCGRPVIEGEIYTNSSKVHLIPRESFPSPVKTIVCGMDHSLFLTKDGQLFSCGWGADGQTGLGSIESTSEPTALKGDLEGVKVSQVSSFGDTNLAVSNDGEVFGWGSSEYGQFGCITDATQVLEPTKLPFNKLKKVKQVAVGGTSCTLLNEDNEVWVWGYGILGKGPNLDSTKWPAKIPATLFGYSDFNNKVKVTEIRSGLGSIAAITNIGELYTWGKNRNGCLGIGSHRDQFFPWKVILGTEVVDVAMGADHMIILSKSLL